MSYTPELKTIHRYWISCHILYIKSFLKSPGQEISEYIVFNSSWEFHFAKFRFQTVVLLKKKSESRYVTYYSLLFLPHEIIPKDLSRSSTSLPWVRIFGLRIKAIREKMPPKLFEISSLSISSSTTNAMASLSSVEERTQFLRPLPFASKLQISKTDGAAGTYYMHTCFWISDKGAKQIIYNLKRKVSHKQTQILIPKVHTQYSKKM